MSVRILVGDALERLRELPDESVHCCVCSPPYWSLRSYMGDPGMIGLEPTFEEHLSNLVAVFREVRRVLRKDGTVWLNYGDAYGADNNRGGWAPTGTPSRGVKRAAPKGGWKPKDLMLMPARVALALQADGTPDMAAVRVLERVWHRMAESYGSRDLPRWAVQALTDLENEYLAKASNGGAWWVRSEIIWHKCLSGGTWLYAHTQKGVGPHMLKDLVRLDPATVELWNGQAWTRVVEWIATPRPDNPREIVLRSGERIGCTPDHRWPTDRGLVAARDLRPGDRIRTGTLPGGGKTPEWLTTDALWFAGLYLAEGSMSGHTIQLAGHVKETSRWERVQRLARWYGATARLHEYGNSQTICLDRSHALRAVIAALIAGRTARTKRLTPAAWGLPHDALQRIAEGYLEGDGGKDGNRIKLGFTRNYGLERDLRCLAARLGARVVIKPCMAGKHPAFRGWWRWSASGHWSEKDLGEVVEVRRSRARKFWDVSVADDPHLFALASGVLTKNSNPMPESVRDRPTSAHEKVFLLTKSGSPTYWTHPYRRGSRTLPEPDYVYDVKSRGKRRRNLWVGHSYFYDSEAVRTPLTDSGRDSMARGIRGSSWDNSEYYREAMPDRPAWPEKQRGHDRVHEGFRDRWDAMTKAEQQAGGASMRNVLKVATHAFKGPHFATFPPKLIEPFIKAGTSEHGCCAECGAPWGRVTEKSVEHTSGSGKAGRPPAGKYAGTEQAESGDYDIRMGPSVTHTTLGWRPTCECGTEEVVPAVCLDPFAGAGTTGLVADRLGRDAILIEISPEYAEMAANRIRDDNPMFAEVAVERADG